MSQAPIDKATPQLTLEIERADNSAVVRCNGKLVAGVTEFLYTNVSDLIPDNRKIVLDLTNLTYMDSMGLGTIIRLFVSAKSAGCDLQLINIGKRIRELLGMTNLLSVLGTCGEYDIRMP